MKKTYRKSTVTFMLIIMTLAFAGCCGENTATRGSGSLAINGDFCGENATINSDDGIALSEIDNCSQTIEIWADYNGSWEDGNYMEIGIDKPWELEAGTFTPTELDFWLGGIVIDNSCPEEDYYPTTGSITISLFDGDQLSGTFNVPIEGENITGSFNVVFDATVTYTDPE